MADDVLIRSQLDGLEFINYEDTKTLTPSNPPHLPLPFFPLTSSAHCSVICGRLLLGRVTTVTANYAPARTGPGPLSDGHNMHLPLKLKEEF